jgi:hypothetical protein
MYMFFCIEIRSLRGKYTHMVVFLLLQLHMGRRPRFFPPLLSNRCTEPVAPCSSPPLTDSEPCVASKINLARLSDVARHHREKLVAEVEEVDGVVPP